MYPARCIPCLYYPILPCPRYTTVHQLCLDWCTRCGAVTAVFREDTLGSTPSYSLGNLLLKGSLSPECHCSSGRIRGSQSGVKDSSGHQSDSDRVKSHIYSLRSIWTEKAGFLDFPHLRAREGGISPLLSLLSTLRDYRLQTARNPTLRQLPRAWIPPPAAGFLLPQPDSSSRSLDAQPPKADKSDKRWNNHAKVRRDAKSGDSGRFARRWRFLRRFAWCSGQFLTLGTGDSGQFLTRGTGIRPILRQE